jgi:uncharacterized protein (UPF0332 family)
MSLEEMVLRAELRRELANPGEIRQLLAGIARRLDDARRVENHPETRIEQAYHAILSCALAALRAEGLRSTNVLGKHQFVLESLGDTLEVESKRIDYYQRLRSLRNKETYEGAVHVSPRDVTEATEEAVWLSERLVRWLERSPSPQSGGRAS